MREKIIGYLRALKSVQDPENNSIISELTENLNMRLKELSESTWIPEEEIKLITERLPNVPLKELADTLETRLENHKERRGSAVHSREYQAWGDVLHETYSFYQVYRDNKKKLPEEQLSVIKSKYQELDRLCTEQMASIAVTGKPTTDKAPWDLFKQYFKSLFEMGLEDELTRWESRRLRDVLLDCSREEVEAGAVDWSITCIARHVGVSFKDLKSFALSLESWEDLHAFIAAFKEAVAKGLKS